MNLHDYLSLGDIRKSDNEADDIDRLPTFLRLLNLSRGSDLIQDVELLEDKAAQYSIAEDIEAIDQHAKLAIKGKLVSTNRDSLEHKVYSVHKDVLSLLQTRTLSPDSWIVSNDPLIGPILASLMYYSNIKYRDIASALYAVNAGHLVKHLGANCPIVVPCMLGITKYDLNLSRRDAGRISLRNSSNYVMDFDPLATALNVIRTPQQEATVECLITVLTQTSKPTEVRIYLKAYCLLLCRGKPVTCDCLEKLQELISRDELWKIAMLCTMIAAENQNKVLLETLKVDPFAFHDPVALQNMIRDVLGVSETFTSGFCDKLSNFCHQQDIQELPLENPALHASLLRHASSAVVRNALHKLLSDQDTAERYWKKPTVVEIIETSTQKLESPAVPLVLPIQIEQNYSMSPTIQWNEQSPSLFLLQLLHCFFFMRIYPKSPFCFDPRELDLKRICLWCDAQKLDICSKIKEFIYNFAPEVKRSQQYLSLQLKRHQKSLAFESMNETKRQLRRTLKRSVENPVSDPCGRDAERAFINASLLLSDTDLVSVSVSSLLSRHSSPALYLTYPMLCKDPLVILKCPVSAVWKRRGTRRLALIILMHLLDTNENIVKGVELSDGIKEEYLASRDMAVLRSLLHLVVQTDACCYHCETTVGLVRKLVAKRRGLVSMSIKQSLTGKELDWMIEHVPEMIYDAPALRSMLHDMSSLTAAERLEIGDGILRLAISQGHGHITESEELVLAALSILVSSFHLIVGPVGVPVAMVINDGKDLDATQASRRAAFRMLKAVPKIRFYRSRLRSECLIALTKLAGLCKGEGIMNVFAGVPRGSGRQKRFLKEYSDAVMKSLDAMGGSNGPTLN